MSLLRPFFTSAFLGGFLTSLAAAQCPEQLMLASDGTDLANYGYSIQVDGNRALIGAAGHVIIPGHGYVMELVGSQWVEMAILDPATDLSGSEAGTGVALAGDVAVVGAPGNDTGAVGNSGEIYIFERQGAGNWIEVAVFSEPILRPNGRFGAAMLLDGNQLLVSASGSGTHKGGIVHVLTRSGSSWSSGAFTGILEAHDAQLNDAFGASMALDGGQLVIGAEHEDEAAIDAGAVYVFHKSGAAWVSTTSDAKLTLSNPLVRDHLGSSVAIEGSRIVAGARGDASNDPGAAYSWDRLGATWVDATENGSMFPSVLGGLRLGTSVAVKGNLAYAGGDANGLGSVRRYRWNGSMWTDELPIGPELSGQSESFGKAIALRGDELWVGATNHREGANRVGAVFRSSARHEFNYCIGAPNSNGGGARLSTCGTTSVANNGLQFVVSAAADGVPGIIFYGANQIQSPFGDGFRCIGGALQRILPASITDPAGGVMIPLDLTSHPANNGTGQINSGSTWNFQYWYRDPMGPGGSGFNVSDAVQVTFTP